MMRAATLNIHPVGTASASSRTVSSICCYCGTGCGVRVTAQDGKVVGVEGDLTHPSNLGRLCSKGLALAETVRSDTARVLHAEWRPGRGLPRVPIALDDALDIAAGRLADTIEAHGPDAVGLYLSGQLLIEDYTVFNKLARGLIGTNNIDTNSRLCMSSAVSGYKMTLGADAPPACYEDLDHAECVLIAGSNMAYAHPVLFRRLEAARATRPDMRIIVVDPRRTDTAALADLHLPIAPGTDVALFQAMLHVMVAESRIDRDYITRHTQGFAAIEDKIRARTPQAAAEICGVPAGDIVQAARWFADAPAALSLYTMGLNQSANGTAKNASLIHLHLATGQIGKPGAGPFSLTGQPNAMGGREAGGMATILPGHRDPNNATHREEVAALWGVPSLPSARGHTALEMFDAVLDGRVKTLWIAATNPAQSLPAQSRIRAALQKAEFVIVQEAYASAETLAYADLVLPAATWPEKDGTVTNSERRISRVRAAIAPPEDARPDWMLASAVARRLAMRIDPGKAALFDYGGVDAIFSEHARSTAGRDLDYSALTHEVLQAWGPQQWPVQIASPDDAPVSTTRLYADGIYPTDNGRARFADVDYMPVAEACTEAFPFTLTTGRLRDHWHTMTRTALCSTLVRHVEEPVVNLNPQDCARLSISAGGIVRLRSARGEVCLPAQPDGTVACGHAFLPMHWGSGFMAGDGINALTHSARDPYSHQPELKHAAISVEPLTLAWQAVAWIGGDADALRQQLRPWLARSAYGVAVPIAVGGSGIRLRLGAMEMPTASLLAELMDALNLRDAAAIFDDPARGVLRRVALQGGQPTSFLLAGDTRAHDALMDWVEGGLAPASLTHVLAGRVASGPRARTVCVCHGVSDRRIQQGLNDGLDLQGLKDQLKCGTGCGSCVPEIVRMTQRHPAAA